MLQKLVWSGKLCLHRAAVSTELPETPCDDRSIALQCCKSLFSPTDGLNSRNLRLHRAAVMRVSRTEFRTLSEMPSHKRVLGFDRKITGGGSYHATIPRKNLQRNVEAVEVAVRIASKCCMTHPKKIFELVSAVLNLFLRTILLNLQAVVFIPLVATREPCITTRCRTQRALLEAYGGVSDNTSFS